MRRLSGWGNDDGDGDGDGNTNANAQWSVGTSADMIMIRS